jgi:TonB family protein
VSLKLILDNLITYSLQIGLLIGLAAFVPALLRLRVPGARLVYWQILLAACLVVPLVRPWKQQVITDNVNVTTTIIAVIPAGESPARPIPPGEIALLVLAGGAVIRLGWLALGLWRLRRYRRHSQLWRGAIQRRGTSCPTLLSEHVASPVTFGFWRPVILLPARFPELDEQKQEVILCHELLHVERRDWLFTFCEELIRAAFWFHPAIWWLLGEIQLSREQAVDRLVVERTRARDEYVDALLAIAGGGAQPDLAPAPLFLRRRHLKQRVVSILKEVRMSRKRWVSALAAALGFLVAACWLVTTTFPLAATPQVVSDGPGVTVDLGGAALMHRAPVYYPESARRSGVQGTVSVEAKLDAGGSVVDARVLTGPDELRKAALMSVFQWHFANAAAGTTRIVSITFQPSPDEPQPAGVVGGVPGGGGGGVPGGVVGGIVGSVPAGQRISPPPPPDAAAHEAAILKLRSQLQIMEKQVQAAQTPAQSEDGRAKIEDLKRALEMAQQQGVNPTVRFGSRRGVVGRTIRSIRVMGLSDAMKNDLLAKLPVHEGDTTSLETMEQAVRAVKSFDEHLMVSWGIEGENDATLNIAAPGYVGEQPPMRIKIGGAVQQVKLIKQPKPVYPAEAKAQRVQGKVELGAIIAKDGTIQHLEVLSGHPLLVPAALEAVKQWVYQPTLLNGNPVEVQTQVDINFTLMQ